MVKVGQVGLQLSVSSIEKNYSGIVKYIVRLSFSMEWFFRVFLLPNHIRYCFLIHVISLIRVY